MSSLFDTQLSQQQLDSLYAWVDNLPLSRPKKNISRDFSDGVLLAQTINYYFPKQIQIHNYPATNSTKNKLQNWKTLNNKVLTKLGIKLKLDELQKLASSSPNCIQVLLYEIKNICAEQDKIRMMNNINNNNSDDKVQNNQSMGGSKNNLGILQGGYSRNANNENSLVEEKPKRDLRGVQVTKIQDLKQILALLKQKIHFVQKNIKRKDAEIKELQDIIQLGI